MTQSSHVIKFFVQDVSTMIRYGLNPVIFLINNGGYTIEVEIHDGPYNTIQNWDYAGLVQCFDNHQGNVFSTKVGSCPHAKLPPSKAVPM